MEEVFKDNNFNQNSISILTTNSARPSLISVRVSLLHEGLVAFVLVVVVTRSELEVNNHGEDVACAKSNTIAVLSSGAFINALHLGRDGSDEAAASS